MQEKYCGTMFFTRLCDGFCQQGHAVRLAASWMI